MLFLISSTLILHTVLFAEEFVWVPKYTKDTLFISAVSKLAVLFPEIRMADANTNLRYAYFKFTRKMNADDWIRVRC